MLDDPSTTSQSGILIAGQLNADVNITASCSETISVANLASGKTVKINGALAAPLIVTGTAGLNGQVIINADNSSESWSGSFTAAGTGITDRPYYASTSLGSGSVGLVPYHLHGQECFPPMGSTIATPAPTVPLEFTFYGPLKYGSGYAASVFRRVMGSGDTWVNITGEFTYSISGRSVLIHKSASTWLESGYEYHIVPGTGLLCDGLSIATDVAVYQDTGYTFTVYGPIVEGCGSNCE